VVVHWGVDHAGSLSPIDVYPLPLSPLLKDEEGRFSLLLVVPLSFPYLKIFFSLWPFVFSVPSVFVLYQATFVFFAVFTYIGSLTSLFFLKGALP